MVLVGERDVGHRACRSGRVNKCPRAAVEESFPFEVKWDALGGRNNIGVHRPLTLTLTTNVLGKGRHGLLDGLYHMALELLERVLYGEQVMPVVVLLQDLLIQSVVHATLKDVGIVGRLDLSARRRESCGVLS